MLIPFIVGVIIHFVIPLQFILTSNPKIEEVYNTYEIEIEQDTIRAVSYLNNQIITNRIQMYENIRAIFLRILDNPNSYLSMNLD